MQRKHKFYLGLFLSLLIVSIMSLTLVYETFYGIYDLKVKRQDNVYQLTEGSGALKVCDDLVDNKFYKPLVSLWLKRHPELLDLKRGEYAIDGSKTLGQILKDMVEGNVVEKVYPTVAIVEGSTFESLLIKFKNSELKEDKFFEEVKNPRQYMESLFVDDKELLEALGGSHDSFEGLLLPATYPMVEEVPFSSVLKQSLFKMANYMRKAWDERAPDLYLKTPYEVLILASIVERETMLDSERAQVAGVFYNRLRKKMRLQTDPTVMYGLSPTFSGKLTRGHLNKDTIYNTYTRDGLPPTPIAMPREASIEAVLHPAKTKALYFVASGVSPKDGHVFSSSLKEHNQAVADYRRKLRKYKSELKKNAKESESTLTDENKAVTVTDNQATEK
ncbi:MAG: endolytic transglycosylase MltG [Succinatimonas sp.]|nr:endolytic transglycosylase MltG [Succinatimonas sp.]